MRGGFVVVCLLGLALAAASDGCGGTVTGGRDAAAGNRFDGEGNGGASGTSGTAGSAGTGGLGPCTCSPGMMCCHDRICANLMSDTNNCGGCDIACGGDFPTCWEWICRRASCEPNTVCTAPQRCCGSVCCATDQLCCFLGQSTDPACVTVTADAPYCPHN